MSNIYLEEIERRNDEETCLRILTSPLLAQLALVKELQTLNETLKELLKGYKPGVHIHRAPKYRPKDTRDEWNKG